MKREFNSISVPMFAAGSYGLSSYFTMELSTIGSGDDWKIWIANTGSQRLSHGHWFDGNKDNIVLLLDKVKNLNKNFYFIFCVTSYFRCTHV